jgi:uncharacterized membrane protein
MSWLRTWVAPLAAAVVVAGAAHLAVVLAAPSQIMAQAMDRLSRDGVRLNRWTHAPRTSVASRRIVRPSPDLAYSSCVYDLSSGPVLITAPSLDDYASLSIFAANTDNFYVVNDRQMPRTGAAIVLVGKGQPRPRTGRPVVVSPSDRGIALLRYLAPTPQRFAAAAAARRAARCETLKG